MARVGRHGSHGRAHHGKARLIEFPRFARQDMMCGGNAMEHILNDFMIRRFARHARIIFTLEQQI